MRPELIVAALAFAIGIAAMPAFGLLARRMNLVDRPDNRRKLHTRHTPLIGGLVVAFASFVAISAVSTLFPAVAEDLPNTAFGRPGVIVGLLLVLGVGAADDRYRLPGKLKLLGQLVAAGFVVTAGVQIDHIDLFGISVQPAVLAVPLTIFWLIGATNSVNLLDGMDGMVGVLTIWACATLAVLGVLNGSPATTVIAIALIGGIAAFLCFNLPPARVFLGDAGSLFLGMVVGTLALEATRDPKHATGTGFTLGPVAISLFVLPMFDSIAAVIRRTMTGQSIFATDRGHLHHRLLQKGLTTGGVLGLVAVFSLVTSAGIVASAALSSPVPMVVGAMLVVGTLIGGRLFGHSELKLVLHRLRHGLQRKARHRGVRVHLQGTSRKWDEVWALVKARAAELNLRSVHFNINAPALHEVYHARWNNGPQSDSIWKADWPLRHHGQTIGCLSVAGESGHGTGPDVVAPIFAMIADVEAAIAAAIPMVKAAVPAPAAVRPTLAPAQLAAASVS